MSKFGLRKLGFGILLFGMAVCCYTASPVKAAETDVPIDNMTFPDATFLKYVGRFDKSGDGKLSESERNAVKKIVVIFDSLNSHYNHLSCRNRVFSEFNGIRMRKEQSGKFRCDEK